MPSTVSSIEIANMALGFIGTRTIASLTENTPEAIQCRLFWDRARRAVLRDYPFPFAQQRVSLAQKEVPEVYSGEWKYAYGYPRNCLKIHRVHGQGKEKRWQNIPFVINNVDGVLHVFANIQPAQAEITVDNTDLSLADDAFGLALARKLACLIVVPLLKNNQTKVQEVEQLYQMGMQSLQSQAASEQEEDEPADTWLLTRM